VGLAVGEAPGDAAGLALGEALGEGEALTETLGEGVGSGRLTGAGPLLRKMNAIGTMMSPARTVTTKETAPHSRRIRCLRSTTADSTD
jgi:hypothetical protein